MSQTNISPEASEARITASRNYKVLLRQERHIFYPFRDTWAIPLFTHWQPARSDQEVVLFTADRDVQGMVSTTWSVEDMAIHVSVRLVCLGGYYDTHFPKVWSEVTAANERQKRYVMVETQILDTNLTPLTDWFTQVAVEQKKQMGQSQYANQVHFDHGGGCLVAFARNNRR